MLLEKEIWKPVVGLEDRYQVSNFGKVKRTARSFVDKRGRAIHLKEKLISPHVDEYVEYVLHHEDGTQHTHTGHRLVAEAFISNPKKYPVINHIDENKLNNCVENLEWCDYSYNVSYAGNRMRISKKLKGTVPANSIAVVDLASGVKYSSKMEACRRLKIPYSKINSLICNGKFKALKGDVNDC